MLTIWKTALKLTDQQEVLIPRGAEILCAREQFGAICIWFRCDSQAPKEPRHIAICGTGHPAPLQGESRYLGTAVLDGGTYIFHIFERTER